MNSNSLKATDNEITYNELRTAFYKEIDEASNSNIDKIMEKASNYSTFFHKKKEEMRSRSPASNKPIPFASIGNIAAKLQELPSKLEGASVKKDSLSNQRNGLTDMFMGAFEKLKSKSNTTKIHNLEDLQSFPTTIDEIYDMKDDELFLGIENIEKDAYDNIIKYGPIDYSIVKKNYFHLDEKQDIDYYKDLSPYARKVLKDPT